jgi:hypothetical protein
MLKLNARTKFHKHLSRKCQQRGLVSFRNLIIEQDASALDETSKRNLQRHLYKSAKAMELSLAEGALQRNHIRSLLTVNREAKVRRSTTPLVLGKVKVMGYEELVEAREEFSEKYAAQKGKSKGRRGQRYTSVVIEDDAAESKTKARRVTEELEPATMQPTTSIAPAPWRAPVARTY